MKKLILLIGILQFDYMIMSAQCLVGSSAELGTLKFYKDVAPNDKRIIREISRIESMFNVSADVLYSSASDINAEAFSYHRYGKDGTIVIYDGLLRFLEGKDYLLFAAILAHEYGHILQNKWGYYQYPLSKKQKELFADYLSGVYMHYRTGETNFNYRDRNSGTTTLLKQINIYNEFGNDLGDKSFGSSDPHGFPKERSDALMGFWHDSLYEIDYIQNHRSKLNNEYYYSIYADGSWWRIGEYFYRIGLRTIHDKF